MTKREAADLEKRLQQIAERAEERRAARERFTPAEAAATALVAYITFVLVTL